MMKDEPAFWILCWDGRIFLGQLLHCSRLAFYLVPHLRKILYCKREIVCPHCLTRCESQALSLQIGRLYMADATSGLQSYAARCC